MKSMQKLAVLGSLAMAGSVCETAHASWFPDFAATTGSHGTATAAEAVATVAVGQPDNKTDPTGTSNTTINYFLNWTSNDPILPLDATQKYTSIAGRVWANVSGSNADASGNSQLTSSINRNSAAHGAYIYSNGGNSESPFAAATDGAHTLRLTPGQSPITVSMLVSASNTAKAKVFYSMTSSAQGGAAEVSITGTGSIFTTVR